MHGTLHGKNRNAHDGWGYSADEGDDGLSLSPSPFPSIRTSHCRSNQAEQMI